MFGFLYALFMGGAYTVKGVRDSIENEEYRRKYRDDETGIYYDRNMRMHDQTTGRIVTYQRDNKTKDMWVVDAETCRKLRNITQNRIDKHYEDERKKYFNNATARTYVKYGDDDHHNDKCRGVRYKDLKTGKLYVMRTIDRYEFDEVDLKKVMIYPICTTCLMDIETGKFIRPTDNALFDLEEYKKDIMYDAIKKENEKKQKKLEKYYGNHKMYEFVLYSNNLCDGTGMELSDENNDYLMNNGMRLI